MTQSPSLPLALDGRGLLPCPFCGGEANGATYVNSRVAVHCSCSAAGPTTWTGGELRGEMHDRAKVKAIEAWNRRAYLSAVPASQAVKELEWTVWPNDGSISIQGSTKRQYVSRALSPFVAYFILTDDEGAWVERAGEYRADGYSDIATAKAAAQADYERRIRSALIAQEPAEGAAPDYAALLRERDEARDRAAKNWRELQSIWNRILGDRPRCRDCADCNGRCQNYGPPCDPTEAVVEKALDWKAIAEATPAKPEGAVNAELLAALQEAKPGEEYRKVLSRIDAGFKTDAALSAPSPREGWVTTHRHKKGGSAYTLFGYGKMQTGSWTEGVLVVNDAGEHTAHIPVDMAHVAIYRSVDDGSLWVRPREEFEDGRFEALPAAPSPQGREGATELEIQTRTTEIARKLEAEVVAFNAAVEAGKQKLRANKAEARLKEALEALKPFAKVGGMLPFVGATEDDEVELSGELLREALLTAARIVKEQADG